MFVVDFQIARALEAAAEKRVGMPCGPPKGLVLRPSVFNIYIYNIYIYVENKCAHIYIYIYGMYILCTYIYLHIDMYTCRDVAIAV